MSNQKKNPIMAKSPTAKLSFDEYAKVLHSLDASTDLEYKHKQADGVLKMVASDDKLTLDERRELVKLYDKIEKVFG